MSDAVVTFYGASDDLVEVEGTVPGCDEYPTNDATFVVIGSEQRKVRVRVHYVEGGIWIVEVGQVDEDVPLLPATIQQSAKAYSAAAIFANVEMVVQEAK